MFLLISHTLYLLPIPKPTTVCSLRRQIGQRSKGLRSDSSRWLEPCMTHLNHWQCLSPKICPIACQCLNRYIWQWHRKEGFKKTNPLHSSEYQNMECKCVKLQNLARSKQQGAGNRRCVISIKQRIVTLLCPKRFLQPPCVCSAVQVVIIPGKAKNTHSWRVENQLWYRWWNYVKIVPSMATQLYYNLDYKYSHEIIQSWFTRRSFAIYATTQAIISLAFGLLSLW